MPNTLRIDPIPAEETRASTAAACRGMQLGLTYQNTDFTLFRIQVSHDNDTFADLIVFPRWDADDHSFRSAWIGGNAGTDPVHVSVNVAPFRYFRVLVSNPTPTEQEATITYSLVS